MASRRGQSAVEYLVTHGWALLVLALVLVLLYSLGIFNPNRLVAEECVFQPGFGCAEPPVLLRYEEGEPAGSIYHYVLEAYFFNGLGFDIKLEEVDVITVDVGLAGQQETPTAYGNQGLLENGKTTADYAVYESRFGIVGDEVMPAVGEMKTLRVRVKYLNCEASQDYLAHKGSVSYCTVARGATEHQMSGRITVRIERGD